MTTLNIFEAATRQKLRFASSRGELTTEQLWDLPLQSKSGFDLDSVAKATNASLKTCTEESFVKTTSNPQQTKYELMMEVIKHIIAAKVAENEVLRKAADRKAEREKLINILSDKEDAALRDLTPEQIRAKLEALS